MSGIVTLEGRVGKVSVKPTSNSSNLIVFDISCPTRDYARQGKTDANGWDYYNCNLFAPNPDFILNKIVEGAVVSVTGYVYQNIGKDNMRYTNIRVFQDSIRQIKAPSQLTTSYSSNISQPESKQLSADDIASAQKRDSVSAGW